MNVKLSHEYTVCSNSTAGILSLSRIYCVFKANIDEHYVIQWYSCSVIIAFTIWIMRQWKWKWALGQGYAVVSIYFARSRIPIPDYILFIIITMCASLVKKSVHFPGGYVFFANSVVKMHVPNF